MTCANQARPAIRSVKAKRIKPRTICTVQTVLRNTGSSPRGLWMMFWRKPTSESKWITTETVVAIIMMPNISGNSSRAMIRLPPRRTA
ncbi:hypothetical protein D3C80_2059670 [compost metagenome]